MKTGRSATGEILLLLSEQDDTIPAAGALVDAQIIGDFVHPIISGKELVDPILSFGRQGRSEKEQLDIGRVPVLQKMINIRVVLFRAQQ